MGEVQHHAVRARRRNAAVAWSTSTPDAPVAAISSVSEVEVSLSTVMQLKVRSVIRLTSACRSRAADRGVGEDIDQHRRHIGRDHARSLGDAGDLDGRRRRTSTVGGGPLGKGVGRHDGAGCGFDAVLGRVRRSVRRCLAVIRSCGSGSPITPVEEVKTRGRVDAERSRPHAPQIASTEARSPARPVKALELPELTRWRRARSRAPPSLGLTIQHRGRAGGRAGEHPGHRRCPRARCGQHHVGPAL